MPGDSHASYNSFIPWKWVLFQGVKYTIASPLWILRASFPKPSLLHHQHETAKEKTRSRGELPPVPSGLLLLLFSFPLSGQISPLIAKQLSSQLEPGLQPAALPRRYRRNEKRREKPRSCWNLAQSVSHCWRWAAGSGTQKVTLMGELRTSPGQEGLGLAERMFLK